MAVLSNAQLQYCTLTARWLAVETPSKELAPPNVHKEAVVYTFMRLFKVASTRRTSFLITSHQIGKFCFSLFSIFQFNLIYTKEIIISMFIFLRSFSHISRDSHVSSYVKITWEFLIGRCWSHYFHEECPLFLNIQYIKIHLHLLFLLFSLFSVPISLCTAYDDS